MVKAIKLVIRILNVIPGLDLQQVQKFKTLKGFFLEISFYSFISQSQKRFNQHVQASEMIFNVFLSSGNKSLDFSFGKSYGYT